MSLDIAKLEKVREMAGGIVQARCPACAEGDADRKGEHLRIFANGSYGCCVHPKDREHNKRIFALAGCKLHLPSNGAFALRLRTPAALPVGKSVKESLRSIGGTPGTVFSESVSGVPATEKLGVTNSWDAWDGSNPPTRVRAREQTVDAEDRIAEKLKESESPVPSVPSTDDWRRRHPTAIIDEEARPLPYLGRDGRLVLPFDSNPRFHYWRGGQSIEATMADVARGFNEQ